MKKNEVGGLCDACGRHERCIQGFVWGALRGRHHLEDPGIDGRIILKCMFMKWDGGRHGLH
jgi:hypothetical protein